MNTEQAKGNWEQVKGKVQEYWGKLTNDDLDVISGKRTQLIGKIRERYGFEKEKAEKEVDKFMTKEKDCSCFKN